MSNAILSKEMQIALYGQQLKKLRKYHRSFRVLMYFSGIVGIWIGLTGIDFCIKGSWGFGLFDLALMSWNIWNAYDNSKKAKELKAGITEIEQELKNLDVAP